MNRLLSSLGSAFAYVLVFLVLLFFCSVAQPVGSVGVGKLLSWGLGFSFLAFVAAPVVAITAIALGSLWPPRKSPSKVWLAAGISAAGAAAMPMIAGFYTERACGWQPMDWGACLDAAYATASDGPKVGYLMAGAQVLAVVTVYVVLRGGTSGDKDLPPRA
ncbi:hypothetical protein ACQ859_27700 [Roseateles chitinivorans]|uniref:hypothetical protein n=1 Tax=Roseateles chitinivorans TaxID=2917965 RepID=UPI003D665174